MTVQRNVREQWVYMYNVNEAPCKVNVIVNKAMLHVSCTVGATAQCEAAAL